MTTYNLWAQAAETVTASGAGNAGTIGLHFTVSSAATLNGIWLYSPSGHSLSLLPATVALYTTQASPATGTLVTSNAATWLTGPGGSTASAGSGWCYAALASPPGLGSGADYMAVAFLNSTSGWFVYEDPYTWPATSGIITAPDDAGTGQGWYDNTDPTLHFPATQGGGNWWLDVQVTSGTAPPGRPALIPPGISSPMNFRRRAVPSQAPPLVAAAESGTGTDTGTVTASASSADAGFAAESATAQPGASDTDTGHGTEAGGVTSASISGTDTGSGAEAGGPVVNLSGADTGSGAEASGVTVRPLLTVRWNAPDRLNRSGGTMGGT